ncbi:MAG: hypothetical protein ACJAZ0_001458 [Halioglobus sp.]|jgi:hypothetical protein
MTFLKRFISYTLLAFMFLVAGYSLYASLTLGVITPAVDPIRDNNANTVVMVFGATGSVGDGLLKAALADPEVDKVYAITRRSSPRMEQARVDEKLEVRMLEDFTDYSSMADILGQVNTVLWGLGTSSLQVDDATYTWIHVDFPVAFVSAWVAAKGNGPRSFHYVTGMGTDANGSSHWAQEKGRAELEVAALAENTQLRTFGYRSAYVRPTSEQANVFNHLGEILLKPGSLVITATALGEAMLEISARTGELANGTLIDNADSIAYAKAYQRFMQAREKN